MTINKVYLIVGGDMRQCYLANLTAKRNKVYVFGYEEKYFECFEKCNKNLIIVNDIHQIKEAVDFLVLPIPCLSDEKKIFAPLFSDDIFIDDILSNVKILDSVFGAMIDNELAQKLKNLGVSVYDYLLREELAVLNAVPTAEGAISIMMNELATTIFGTKCLLMGYGRISKVLVKYLTSLGVRVSVCARKYSDLAWAKIYGCEAVHMSNIKNNINTYNVIINTAPAVIFDKTLLGELSENCLVIDLASKPGGVDFETAKQLGIKTIWALSLPGKVAPISSGEIIFDTIQNIIFERG